MQKVISETAGGGATEHRSASLSLGGIEDLVSIKNTLNEELYNS